MKRWLILLWSTLGVFSAFGQDSGTNWDPSALSSQSEWRVGLKYTSDYLYMGRSDSAKAPYLSPSVGYYHKSGLFLRTSLSFLTTKEDQRIDLYTLSGGYDYYGKRLATGISLTEYFFSDKSYTVQAEMNTYVNAYFGYDFKLLIAYWDASLGFSESTDAFLGMELNRTFYLLHNKLRITPSLYANAGSQRYYEAYYVQRSIQTGAGGGSSGKGKGGNGQMSGGTTTTSTMMQVVSSDQFQLLDYEGALQLVYKWNKIKFFTIGTWTFPVNPATVVTDQGTYEEALSNGFYWTAGMRWTF